MSCHRRNMRFRVFINGGWVKLTLRPGQSLSWGRSGPDEEGYSFESVTWEAIATGVMRSSSSGGRDCDGYTEHSQSSYCPEEALWAEVVPSEAFPEDPVYCPRWEGKEEEVYDQYAQLDGY